MEVCLPTASRLKPHQWGTDLHPHARPPPAGEAPVHTLLPLGPSVTLCSSFCPVPKILDLRGKLPSLHFESQVSWMSALALSNGRQRKFKTDKLSGHGDKVFRSHSA